MRLAPARSAAFLISEWTLKSTALRSALQYLDRHHSGDWGDLGAVDWRANDQAVETGARLFSAYAVRQLNTLGIITEARRSSTTLLLPEDY